MCFTYLSVLESRLRTVTSRPELIPSVTLLGGGRLIRESGQTPTPATVRGQVWLSGPTVGMNHGKATKKHKKSVWYWHHQNMS